MVESGHVQEVILENFKSYEGRVRVGPFKKFTCVVGQNGVGKSNLLDAIAFVLCLSGAGRRRRAGTGSRDERLSDLAHQKAGDDPASASRVVSVELRHARGVCGSVDVLEKSFKRMLNPDGSLQFQVDGVDITEEQYLSQLEEINILTEARNFFVFQGDVEAAAKRQGKDLAKFFEQISGSNAYQDEYQRIAAEKAQKEDEVRLLYHRKKDATNDKKVMSNQKADAERYQRLEAARHTLQLEYYLFRFQVLASRAEVSQGEVAEIQAEREVVLASLNASNQQVKEAETKRAAAHLAARRAAKTAAVIRVQLDQQNPELKGVCSKLEILTERVDEMRKKQQTDEVRISELMERRDALENEQRESTAKVQDLEAAAKKEMHFTDAQRRQYEFASAEADRTAAPYKARLRDLQQQIRLSTLEKQRNEREEQEVKARCGHLARKVKTLLEKQSEHQAAFESDSATLLAVGRQLASLKAKVLQYAKEREDKMAERHRKFQGVQDIAATERQIQHEHEMVKVTSDLVRLFPGVRGRILDLCRPANDTYSVALDVALGSSSDSIVTDTADVARQCVQYLKDHMLQPMTFMPLDNLRVADSQLHSAVEANPAVRLALHCVSFDERLGRAFHFLLGDVVFADTLDDGRRFAYADLRSRNLQARVVTLDGMQISRDGNISVNSERTRKGATRLLLSQLEKDRESLALLDQRLQQLHRFEASSGEQLATLQEQVRRLELRTQEQQQHLNKCNEELASLQLEVPKEEAELIQLQKTVKDLSVEENRCREELKRVDDDISQRTKSHFDSLSAEMGVPDIRQQEREWRSEKEKAKLKCRELSLELGGTSAELSMVKQTLAEKEARSGPQAVAECEAEIVRLKEQQQQLSQQIQQLGNVDELEESKENVLEEEHAAERALAVCRQNARDDEQRLAEIDTRQSKRTIEAQDVGEAKIDLLQRSILEGVEVPLLAGGGDGSVNIDLSQLPESKREAASVAAAELLEDEYRLLLQQAEAELQRARPNFRAEQELHELKGRTHDINDDYKTAHKAIEEVKRRFEEVRSLRRELFMRCFTQVATAISDIYKELSRTATGYADGGSAFLDLEDVEDPWNGGVKFTAMPPTKRFCDISLLSGGERALAALALLFAVQAYQKPPFLILDEVDAHLDAGGVRALASYVASCSCQTLVVSLRDHMFTRSEGLVGVSKDDERQSSVVFSVDLTQFRRRVATPATSMAPPPLMAPSPAKRSPGGFVVSADAGVGEGGEDVSMPPAT